MLSGGPLFSKYPLFDSAHTQFCPALCDLMDCSLPGPSVHGIFQARILEWIAISSSRRIFSTHKSKYRWTQTAIIKELIISWMLHKLPAPQGPGGCAFWLLFNSLLLEYGQISKQWINICWINERMILCSGLIFIYVCNPPESLKITFSLG